MTTCQKKSRLRNRKALLRSHKNKKCALIVGETIFFGTLRARTTRTAMFCKIEASLDGTKPFLASDIADIREVDKREKVLVILLKDKA
jgi:hypothetical protein